VRKKWQKISGQPYQCKILDVQLNLTSSDKEPEQWRNVRLLFVRGNTEVEKQDTGKHDWAVFLSTDVSMRYTWIHAINEPRNFSYEHTKTYSNEVDRSNISCIVDTLLFQET
jgi:hypothetical protein